MPGHDDLDERPSKRRRHDASYSVSPDRTSRRESQRNDKDRRSLKLSDGQRTYQKGRRKGGENDGSNDDESRDRSRRTERRRSRDRDHENKDRETRRHRRRSDSPRERHHRHRSRSRDRDKHRHTSSRHRSRSPSPSPLQRSKAPLPSQSDAFRTTSDPQNALDKPLEKQKANFATTGKLAAAANTIQTANQTIVLKYHEPPESRKPPASQAWRMYIFKASDILDTVELSEQSCWLFGRETAVCDVPIEHLSCSKQHAVIQFRYIEKWNEFGEKKGKVKPYLLDLESANGTKMNGQKVPDAKYVEIRDGDVIMFGDSTREYVVQLPPAAKTN